MDNCGETDVFSSSFHQLCPEHKGTMTVAFLLHLRLNCAGRDFNEMINDLSRALFQAWELGREAGTRLRLPVSSSLQRPSEDSEQSQGKCAPHPLISASSFLSSSPSSSVSLFLSSSWLQIPRLQLPPIKRGHSYPPFRLRSSPL